MAIIQGGKKKKANHHLKAYLQQWCSCCPGKCRHSWPNSGVEHKTMMSSGPGVTRHTIKRPKRTNYTHSPALTFLSFSTWFPFPIMNLSEVSLPFYTAYDKYKIIQLIHSIPWNQNYSSITSKEVLLLITTKTTKPIWEHSSKQRLQKSYTVGKKFTTIHIQMC